MGDAAEKIMADPTNGTFTNASQSSTTPVASTSAINPSGLETSSLTPGVSHDTKYTAWVVFPILALILCALVALGFMSWRRKRAYGTYNIFRSPRGEARHHLIPVYNWQNSNSNGGLLSRPDIRHSHAGYDPFDPANSSYSGSSRSLNENPMAVTNQNHSAASMDINWEDRLLDDEAVYRPSVYQPNLNVGNSPSLRPRLEFSTSNTGKL